MPTDAGDQLFQYAEPLLSVAFKATALVVPAFVKVILQLAPGVVLHTEEILVLTLMWCALTKLPVGATRFTAEDALELSLPFCCLSVFESDDCCGDWLSPFWLLAEPPPVVGVFALKLVLARLWNRRVVLVSSRVIITAISNITTPRVTKRGFLYARVGVFIFLFYLPKYYSNISLFTFNELL
jgi:hypothetical protein